MSNLGPISLTNLPKFKIGWKFCSDVMPVPKMDSFSTGDANSRNQEKSVIFSRY